MTLFYLSWKHHVFLSQFCLSCFSHHWLNHPHFPLFIFGRSSRVFSLFLFIIHFSSKCSFALSPCGVFRCTCKFPLGIRLCARDCMPLLAIEEESNRRKITPRRFVICVTFPGSLCNTLVYRLSAFFCNRLQVNSPFFFSPRSLSLWLSSRIILPVSTSFFARALQLLLATVLVPLRRSLRLLFKVMRAINSARHRLCPRGFN